MSEVQVMLSYFHWYQQLQVSNNKIFTFPSSFTAFALILRIKVNSFEWKKKAQRTDLLSSGSGNEKVKEYKIQPVNFKGRKKTPSSDASSNLVVACTTPKDVLQEMTLFSVIMVFTFQNEAQETASKPNPKRCKTKFPTCFFKICIPYAGIKNTEKQIPCRRGA